MFLLEKLKSFFVYQGEFLSISGPDGSGKSTIIAKVQDELAKSFVTNYNHFRPSVLPRIATLAKKTGVVSQVDENYSEPHRGAPSGFIGSLVRFTYYYFDYLWGYIIKIRPALVRGELVIYDRYFFDMVADPGRSRINLPLWILRLGLKFLPMPHTAIFIHVSADKVRQRKQELSIEKIHELNLAYLEMVKSSHMVVLDNSGCIESTVARFVDVVLERRRRRLKIAGLNS